MPPPLRLPEPRWSLLRVPVLPAVPVEPEPELSRQLLELAVEYAATFQRPEDDDRAWQDDSLRTATYRSRARFRPTPFGLFGFSLLADLVEDAADGDPADHHPPVQVDLATEVKLRRLDLPQQTGSWFVNPTLAVEDGRWSYVRPDKGGTIGLSADAAMSRLAELLAELRATGARSREEWIGEFGAQGAEQFDIYARRHLLLPEYAPPALVENGAPPPPAESVKAALTMGSRFRAAEFVDTYTEVRASLAGSRVTALLDGAAQLTRFRFLPGRLSRAREYLTGAFSGGAVPLSWLLAAPVDHPLGGWRLREDANAPARRPERARRLFVPRGRRDLSAVEWWNQPLTVDDWWAGVAERPDPVISEGSPVNRMRFGMLCGALLDEPCTGADVWLKMITPGFWGGPAARLGDSLGLPALDPGAADPGRLAVEIGWTPPNRLAPLTRRRDAGLPRLNLNLPHRAGDVRLSDLVVGVVDGRLQLVHRHDGRLVELRWDSPLALSNRIHPWVVQLLGLLMEEAGDSMGTGNPGIWDASSGMNPRITAGRCLLARRGVVLDAQHRADLLELATDPVALCEVLDEVGLGPQIEVTELSDLTMKLDLTDAPERRWFLQRLRRASPLSLHESLPVATPVRSDLGRHVHDVWVPWVRPDSPPTWPFSTTRVVDRMPRADPEWTSWYAYAPERVVETWLGRPDVVALMRRGELFFIRYRDQRPHVRIRVRRTVDAEPLLASLRAHLAAMVPQQPVEVATGEWIPEDYRYGGAARRADTLRHFCADSAWWAQRLAAGPDAAGRYVLAAARIAAWCQQLAGERSALILLCELRGLDPRLPGSLAQKDWMATYRAARRELEHALDAALGERDPSLDHLAGLDEDARRLTLSSMIHMSVNRGMPLGQAVSREPEIVLAAARLLKGRRARAAAGARDA